MAALIIKNLDEDVKILLAQQAKRNNCSMEDYVCHVLTEAACSCNNVFPASNPLVSGDPDDRYGGLGFGVYWAQRFGGLGEDLVIEPRTSSSRPIPFTEDELQ